jgi:hypothetical protein
LPPPVFFSEVVSFSNFDLISLSAPFPKPPSQKFSRADLQQPRESRDSLGPEEQENNANRISSSKPPIGIPYILPFFCQ